jgi:hypothetical protein
MIHILKNSSRIERTRETLQGEERGPSRPRCGNVQKGIHVRKVNLCRPYMLMVKATLAQ